MTSAVRAIYPPCVQCRGTLHRGVLHPGVPVMWHAHIRDLSPTAETVRRTVCHCVHENTRRRSKVIFKRTFPSSQLFSAMPPLEAVNVLVLIMMSVSWSNKGKPLKLRQYDPRDSFYIRLPAEDRQKYGEDRDGTLVKSMYELKVLPTSGNLIMSF